MSVRSKEKDDSFVTAILQWFQQVKRPLPWRESRDPYRILVSEIMLQQTRVDTVIPYYHRFMERYPTLHHLAYAAEEEVLKLWEGLGYYSRARHLLQAVREVEHTYGGVIPSDETELTKLPGIGPYTRGAVLSIAYGKRVPAVDGNVLRVASRLFGIRDDIGKNTARKKIETALSWVIPEEQPGEFNQALMELGALICLPKNPDCTECPISSFCEAYQLGLQDQLPYREKKERSKIETRLALLIKSPLGFLMRKRRERLLHGMWEFPNWVIGSEPTFLHLFSLHAPKRIGEVTHIFTHKVWRLQVYALQIEQMPKQEGIEDLKEYRWVEDEEYAQLPVPVPFQKAMELWKARIAEASFDHL